MRVLNTCNVRTEKKLWEEGREVEPEPRKEQESGVGMGGEHRVGPGAWEGWGESIKWDQEPGKEG